MKIQLEVLASSSIKRNKPWPNIKWIGSKDQKSLLLLDQTLQRCSILYLPSGKTNRDVPKLCPLVKEALVLSCTRNGGYVTALSVKGEILLWHKDTDVVKTIKGLNEVVDLELLLKEENQLFVDNEGKYAVLALGKHQLLVWTSSHLEPILQTKDPELEGSWSKIVFPNNVVLPQESNKEAALDVVFFFHHTLGYCCHCTIAHNGRQHLHLLNLLIRLGKAGEVHDSRNIDMHVEWSTIQYQFEHINRSYSPLSIPGALHCCYANSGQVMAVVTNQNIPENTKILFVSPLTDSVVTCSMKGCGFRDPRQTKGRMYWVNSMQWTYDDLFLCCMLESGAACLVTRLGEPTLISTYGNSLELGPTYFLPLHPKQYITKLKSPNLSQTLENEQYADPLGQKMSVTTHPSLPMILFSDGFMVTVVKLAERTNCVKLMSNLVLLSSNYIRDLISAQNMDMTLADAYGMPSSRDTNSVRNSNRDRKKNAFKFEPLDSNLNTTRESDKSFLEDNLDVLEGKMAFADIDVPYVDPTDLSDLDPVSMAQKQLFMAEDNLLTAWKLAVSFVDVWSADADKVANLICKNLSKLFHVMLEAEGMEEVLALHHARNPRVFCVTNLFKKTRDLIRFDTVNQYLMPVMLKFTHYTLNLILNSKTLKRLEPKWVTLLGCYTLLVDTEKCLNEAYTWVPTSPSDISDTGLPAGHGIEKHYYEPSILVKSQISPRGPGDRDLEVREIHGVPVQKKSTSRRLCASWKLLYKVLLQLRASADQSKMPKSERDKVDNLMSVLQDKIQEVGGATPQMTTPRISQGDRLNVDGQATMAIDAYNSELQMLEGEERNVAKNSQLFHQILYTCLKEGKLAKAIDFVDSQILQADAHLSTPAREGNENTMPLMMTVLNHSMKLGDTGSGEKVPCIKDRAVRQLVQSMARFMASYFANQPLYVFPPHNAQSLPVIHLGPTDTNVRKIPLYSEDVSRIISEENISHVWTTERVLEYLLLSGLVCEAVWFAHTMGDWKAAFMLSVACTSHHMIASRLYKKKRKPLLLPDELSPLGILSKKLENLVHHPDGPTSGQGQFLTINNNTNLQQLTHTMEDILLAGIISDVELVPWLLTTLIDQLKHVMSNLPPRVPKDFYLPSPPVFCPLPTDTEEGGKSAYEKEREKSLRCQIHSLVHLLLVVFNASRTSLPAARWYVQSLVRAQEKAKQFKGTTESPSCELPEKLQVYRETRSLLGNQKNPSVMVVLQCFRDFCSLLWLMHARDKLSMGLRKLEAQISNINYEDYVRESWDAKRGDPLVKECFVNLQWAVHMLVFCRFLPEEASVYKVVLSLLQDLPANEDTADILAEYFYDFENLDPEIQEKLESFLSNWQGVVTKPEDDGKSAKPSDSVEEDENEGRKSVTFLHSSPRGQILSVYFQKQCEVIMKVINKKMKVFGDYEEFLFDESGKINKTASLKEKKKHNGRHGYIKVGSRPFETKASYLEFLDSFFDICFTEIQNTEIDKGRSYLPFLKIGPFVDEISAQQFRELKDVTGRDTRKRQNLVVLSTPRKQEKSSAESPYRGTDNVTSLVSKFSQSENILYKDALQENVAKWSANINFGTKYLHLQDTLDWLYRWTNKNHSLGLKGQEDKDLQLKPSMKIRAPPTLVVLSLWLLENKYLPSKRKQPASQQGESIHNSHNLSVIKEDIVVQEVSLSKSAKSHSQHVTQEELKLNLSTSLRRTEHDVENEYDQDTNDVHTAYEKILDNPGKYEEESASPEVSSLGTDEYSPGLLKLSSGPRSSEVVQGSLGFRTEKVQSKENLQSSLNKKLGESLNSTGKSKNSGSSSPRRSRQADAGGRSRREEYDMAKQVQNIVRSELRRMMEVQHKNMMAMMGALDDLDVQDGYHVSQRSRSSPQHTMRSPSRSKSPHNRSARSENRSTMLIDELNSSGRGLKKNRGPGMRGTLTELKNLQNETGRSQPKSTKSSQKSRRQPSPGKENVADIRQVQEEITRGQNPEDHQVHFFPNFLRVPAERDSSANDHVRFPPIVPPEAPDGWYLPPQQREDTQVPLLNLHGYTAPSKIFPGVHKYPSELPDVASSSHPDMFAPPSGVSGDSVPKIGIQLLKLPEEKKPFLGPQPVSTFGRLLAPHLIIEQEHERRQKELLKKRHAQEFHKMQVEDLEELEKQRFGENLLKVNLQFQELKEKKDEEAKERQELSQKRRKRVSHKKEKKTPDRTPTPKKASPVTASNQQRGLGEKSVEAPSAEVEDEEDTREEESSVTKTTDQETEDEIHDGFAIKPGTYDNYLMAHGAQDDTHARIQYKTAMILKRQREERKKRQVEFATNTVNYQDVSIGTGVSLEGDVRTAEAATSITKDKGVDPIQEAIVEYNRARQGAALPPDIYLGLRFGDEETQPSSDDGKDKSKGRAYLNVVDLDASMVLNDLRKIREEEKVQEDMSLLPQSHLVSSATPLDEGSLRKSPEPREVIQRTPRHDAITVQMFESHGLQGDRVSIALVPRESVQDSRFGVIQRLRNMDSQMMAIDKLSTNIERDFQQTHAMLHTLETLNAAELAPVARDTDLEEGARPKSTSRSEGPAPTMSERSPSISARTTSRTGKVTARSDKEKSMESLKGSGKGNMVHVSGLSGVSDIIGDMVKRGEIDLEEAGFTPKEMEQFAEKSKLSVRSGQTADDRERIQKSLEFIEAAGLRSKVKHHEEEERDAERKKEELQAWMSEKRTQRLEDYRKKLTELREHEHKPFKPSGGDVSLRGPATELAKDRKVKVEGDMKRRMDEAQGLLSDILTDKPKLPADVTRDTSPKRRTITISPKRAADTSPKRQTVTIAEPSDHGASPKGPNGTRWVPYDDKPIRPSKQQRGVNLEDIAAYSNVNQHPGIMKKTRRVSPPGTPPSAPQQAVPRLIFVDSAEFTKTGETTGDLTAYAKVVEEMEITGESDQPIQPHHRPRSPSPPIYKGPPYKPKPFTELVKVQRPEVTRKGPASKIPVPYVQRLAAMHDEPTHRDVTDEELHKIYGSRRLPGRGKPIDESPRMVKTYAERLQEMKNQKQVHRGPIVPRTHIAGTGSVRGSQLSTVSRKSHAPPHKPLTYVERLKKLNEGTHRPRKASGKVKMATYLKPHKPAHRPQTYAQQLQALQPPHKVKKPSPGKPRPRPYADPYSHDGGDADSVLSSWSVDDNVHHLLYDDETSTVGYTGPSEYPRSEGVSDYFDYVMGSEYVGSVDIDEIAQIADAASVDTGSVMSVIDWDAIDNLIADVK